MLYLVYKFHKKGTAQGETDWTSRHLMILLYSSSSVKVQLTQSHLQANIHFFKINSAEYKLTNTNENSARYVIRVL